MPEIKRVAVVGAGTMGNGIVHVFAQTGYDVTMVDVRQEALDGALKTIGGNMDRQIKKGTLAEADLPGTLALLDRPLFKYGALAMGAGELAGDKMKTAPDRTVFLGLLARVMSAGIAGAALAPRGREQAGAVAAIATAVPLAYLTLAGRKQAMARIVSC